MLAVLYYTSYGAKLRQTKKNKQKNITIFLMQQKYLPQEPEILFTIDRGSTDAMFNEKKNARIFYFKSGCMQAAMRLLRREWSGYRTEES